MERTLALGSWQLEVSPQRAQRTQGDAPFVHRAWFAARPCPIMAAWHFDDFLSSCSPPSGGPAAKSPPMAEAPSQEAHLPRPQPKQLYGSKPIKATSSRWSW